LQHGRLLCGASFRREKRNDQEFAVLSVNILRNTQTPESLSGLWKCMDYSVQMFDYKFPSGEGVEVLRLAINLDELAARLGITLEDWEEDGFGPARGAFVRLPSHTVILVRELQYLRRGDGGVDIIVDAGSLADRGLDLPSEICKSLQVLAPMILWKASEETLKLAKEISLHMREKNGREPSPRQK
jgi:hypothetical protein